GVCTIGGTRRITHVRGGIWDWVCARRGDGAQPERLRAAHSGERAVDGGVVRAALEPRAAAADGRGAGDKAATDADWDSGGADILSRVRGPGFWVGAFRDDQSMARREKLDSRTDDCE